MDHELTAISDFVNCNRKELAAYVRQKLVAAGAKAYVDRLGKDGIEAMDREAAGILLDLACALLRRLEPGQPIEAQDILAQLPEAERNTIHLPRSEAYDAIMEHFKSSQVAPKDDSAE